MCTLTSVFDSRYTKVTVWNEFFFSVTIITHRRLLTCLCGNNSLVTGVVVFSVYSLMGLLCMYSLMGLLCIPLYGSAVFVFIYSSTVITLWGLWYRNRRSLSLLGSPCRNSCCDTGNAGTPYFSNHWIIAMQEF